MSQDVKPVSFLTLMVVAEESRRDLAFVQGLYFYPSPFGIAIARKPAYDAIDLVGACACISSLG